MNFKLRSVILAVLVLAAIGGGIWLLNGRAEAKDSALTASGTIETVGINIASEVAGRIVAIHANEGDQVTAGQTLVELDHTLLDAQLAQAVAAVNTANAQLAQASAGPRPDDVRQAQTALTQTIVVRDGAQRAWVDAQAVRDNPQELNARLAAAQALVDAQKNQVEVAKHNVQMSVANAQAAQVRKDSYAGAARALPDARVAVNDWWAAEEQSLGAQATLDAVQASVAGAQQNLDILLNMKANPLTANAQVDAAKQQYDTVAASVDVAQARLDAIQSGPSRESIAVAEAQVKQAEAALAAVRMQLTKLTLVAPADGVILMRVGEPGEVAVPGATLLTLGRLDALTITVYVPENQYGKLHLGQVAQVAVDSFPAQTFSAKLTRIADQAVFTPRNVQTAEGRATTVYAVKLLVENADGKLKPGMPADVKFGL